MTPTPITTTITTAATLLLALPAAGAGAAPAPARALKSGLRTVRCGRHRYRVFTRIRSKSSFGQITLDPSLCP